MLSPDRIKESTAIYSKLLMASIGITVLIAGGIVNLLMTEHGEFFWWFLTAGGGLFTFFVVTDFILFKVIMRLISQL